MLSIIVPVYNVEKYIEKCLDSILHSTYKKLEVIVVDDGSTDKSGEICDRYREKYKNVIVLHQQNKGQGVARNIALKIAKGEYIGFVDSDDYIEETMYEKMMSTCKEYDADVTICRHYDYFNGKKIPKLVDTCTKIYTGEQAAKLALEDKRINTYVWDKIFKRSLFENVYFTPGRYFEDTMLVPRLLIKTRKVVCIPDPLYYYRYRLNGTMNTLNKKRFTDKIYAVEDNILFSKQEFPELMPLLLLRNSEAIRDLADSKSFNSLSSKEKNAYIKRYRECYLLCKSVKVDFTRKEKFARLLLYINPQIYNLLRKVI